MNSKYKGRLMSLILLIIIPFISSQSVTIKSIIPYENNHFIIDQNNPMQVFQYTLTSMKGDLIMRFEIGTGFTVKGFLFSNKEYITCIQNEKCLKQQSKEDIIHFKLKIKEMVIKSDELKEKGIVNKDNETIYIVLYDNKYSYEDYFILFKETDMIKLKLGEPLLIKQFYSLNEYLIKFETDAQCTNKYIFQMNSEDKTIIEIKNSNGVEILKEEINIVDKDITLECNSTYFVTIKKKNSSSKKEMFSMMLTEEMNQRIIEIKDNQILKKDLITSSRMYFFYNITHYDENEENYIILSQVSNQFNIKIASKKSISISSDNFIDLYDEVIPLSLVKEVNRLNSEQTNYYMKIKRGKKIENESEFVLFTIDLQSKTSFILPDSFIITVSSRIETKRLDKLILEQWSITKLDINLTYPLFIKYELSSKDNIIIHSNVENLLSIITDKSDEVYNVDTLALLHPENEETFSFVLKVNEVSYVANELSYSFFITESNLRPMEKKQDLKILQYCFNCFTKKFYIILHDNYFITNSHTKDSIFKRFNINVITPSNDKIKAKKLKNIANIYYDEKEKDDNSILLLEVESKEVIIENNINVIAKENSKGNILIKFNNEKQKDHFNEYVIYLSQIGDDNSKDVEISIKESTIINKEQFEYELFNITPGNYNIKVVAYNTSDETITKGELYKPVNYMLTNKEEEGIVLNANEERLKDFLCVIIISLSILLLLWIVSKFIELIKLNEKKETSIPEISRVNRKEYKPIATEDINTSTI